MRIYYARCMSEYGTKSEGRTIEQFEKLGFTVIKFPTATECTAGKARGEDIMETMFRPLVESASALFFQGISNDDVTAGVAKEVEYAYAKGIPVFEVTTVWCDKNKMSIRETREFIRLVT